MLVSAIILIIFLGILHITMNILYILRYWDESMEAIGQGKTKFNNFYYLSYFLAVVSFLVIISFVTTKITDSSTVLGLSLNEGGKGLYLLSLVGLLGLSMMRLPLAATYLHNHRDITQHLLYLVSWLTFTFLLIS